MPIAPDSRLQRAYHLQTTDGLLAEIFPTLTASFARKRLAIACAQDASSFYRPRAVKPDPGARRVILEWSTLALSRLPQQP